MKVRSAAALLLFSLFTATTASAASFRVPTDRELVDVSKAIVIATAVTSYPIHVENGYIDTVFEFRVEEVIKGDVNMSAPLRLSEMGGSLDGAIDLVPDSPKYAIGERALIFVGSNKRGEDSTWGMILGKFNFVRDLHGRRLLIRGAGQGEIFGWDACDNRHEEPMRSESEFLNFVRAAACGGSASENYIVPKNAISLQPRPNTNSQGYHADDYQDLATPGGGGLRPGGLRWQGIFDQPGGGGSITFVVVGTESGIADPLGGITRAMDAWNGDALSNVNYIRGGSSNVAFANDGIESIHLDDSADVPGGAVGYARLNCSGPGCAFYAFDGAQMASTTDADVAVVPGLSQATYEGVLTHELGHTLSIRHSNERTPSSSSAAMNSVCCPTGGAVLGTWDHDAVSTIYNPSPGVTCTPPSATTPTANPTTITSGNSSTLTANVTGTAPFTYLWYQGPSGNVSTPLGGGATKNVSPTTTTQYWVRVTGQCAPTSDSPAVTVTVQACVAPNGAMASANPTTIFAGNSTTLSVTASGSTPQTFQWYTGTPGSGTPINGATGSSITQSPSVTTAYYARVTNSCGFTDSNAVTVTVQCQPVQIFQQPFASPSSITAGNSTLIQVGAVGTNRQYQWYIGMTGDTSTPVNGATAFQFTATLNVTTTFWVRVSGDCGRADSDAVTVTVAAQCVDPANAVATASPGIIQPGGTSTLSVSATGTGLTFQWFTGTPPGGSAIPGATNAILPVQPAATTTYYAKVTGQCGQPINTNAVTVTVSAACIGPSITTHPASKTSVVGGTVTLSVVAAGTAPLHYQWYEGVTGDKSKKRGTDSPTFTTAPLLTRTQFWVEVSGNCGQPVNSNTATIDPKDGRPRAVRH